ncbi:MAG: 2-oxoacid:acceptor oxidoreductase family protein [Candidatus Bipolaricaulota bacterium]|nr:MAG: 2-oxoacid:acceptor oxidoreductase family protein [Candidatus Bipolaricaulota bacterium]
MRSEVRFAGFGGQGIISAGKITGRAASIFDGKEAVMMQSYGPEARGGACNSDLVVADTPIGSPQLSVPGIAVIMSQEAYDKYGGTIREDGTLIIDEDLVEFEDAPPIEETFRIPATRIADELGRKIVANVVMLGALAAITKLVTREAMLEAILSSVPPKTKELNERAFTAGFEKGEEVLGARG